MRQHFAEVFNTGRRQRADWTPQDGVGEPLPVP